MSWKYIYIDEIETIENNIKSKTAKIYERDLKGKKCEFCSQFQHCKGGEKGRAYEVYKDVNFPDPRCTFLEKYEKTRIDKKIL